MIGKFKFTLMFAILITCFASVLNASQVNEESKHIRFKAVTSTQIVEKDKEFVVNVTMELDKYWYTYSIHPQVNPEGIGPQATEFLVAPKDILTVSGKIGEPKPYEKMDSGFEINIQYYKGTATFQIPIKSKKGFDITKDSIFVLPYVQICDTTSCRAPEEYRIHVTFDPESASTITYTTGVKHEKKKDETSEKVDQTKTEQTYTTESTAEIDAEKKKGIWSFLWFAMSAGALALLTPCVFPMVPITVSFFTKRAEKEKSKGLRDASLYALGIITTFTLLGFVLAIIFGASGIQDFATNGWVNIFIAAIFIIFALNLFGAFEIQLPTGLMNKLNSKSQGSGIMSVMLMGLTFSITSFTCTVPFVGTVLIAVADGEIYDPIIGMLGFSSVFAAPFFLLALFPSFMQKLPKAGGWMNNVKVVMGFIEVAAAIKFISNADMVWSWGVMPREFFISIWIACTIMIVLYILGKFKLAHDAPLQGLSAMRLIFATLFLSITFYLLYGLSGKSLGELDAFMPPPDYHEMMGGSSASVAAIAAPGNTATDNWLKDYNQAVEEAKKQNKLLFVDFTGYTCTNCRWMETKMFPRPNILSKMNQMIKVKLYTDRNSEPYISNKMLQKEKFGSLSLPLYVLLKPDGTLIGTAVFDRDEQKFVDFLEKGLNAMK